MTILGILLTLIIGILMFIIGIKTKKKWLMVISIIPLIIVLSQIVMLILMAFN